MGLKKHSTEGKGTVSESTPLSHCEMKQDTSSIDVSMMLWPPYIHLASEIQAKNHFGDLGRSPGQKRE